LAGAVVETVVCDQSGTVDVDHLESVLDERANTTALVAVMWANNEVGTIQPISAISALCRDRGVPLHTDAIQAVGSVPVLPSLAGTLSLSGHKFGGPPGTGALVAANEIDPILRGGGQERGLRAGTSNVPGAAGLAVALEEAIDHLDAHGSRMRGLRDKLTSGITRLVPDAVVNSSVTGLPGIAHVTFPGCPGDALLMLLDAEGIAASAGSACSAGVAQPSKVLLAMGASPEAASQSLRFSLGWTSTDRDIADVLRVLPDAVSGSRSQGRVAVGSH
ncbi:MAG: aminotransferase class V-fold PLP-dependent enzyme, partial [Candidatus Nanopelagicales bacterium]|nr:aminotransferase class V-fold PLP-dependent enzyme [Candidatus Nanopelagicales bacterium]